MLTDSKYIAIFIYILYNTPIRSVFSVFKQQKNKNKIKPNFVKIFTILVNKAKSANEIGVYYEGHPVVFEK